MADNRDEQRQDTQEYEFVKERIIEKPKKKKNFFVKLIGIIVLGAAFGGMGAITFAFVFPYVQQIVEKPEETTTPEDKVVIPKDDDTTEPSISEQPPVTTEPTPSEEQSTTDEQQTTDGGAVEEPKYLSEAEVKELIEQALATKELELTDYQKLFGRMYEVVTDANNSIVTITSVKSSTDIMDNLYEESENTSGIIYKITENTVFILTDWDSVKDADFIKVSFFGGFSCNAAVRMYDVSSNMAVICVDTVLFDEHSLGKIKAVTLGNSNNVKQGDPVIAIGNPMGYMYTMSYGVVTTVRNTIQSVDAVYRRLDTSVIKSNEGNGFLINLKGELIGVVMSSDAEAENSNVLNALALSDLKGRLEVISNNREVAYLGILGQDITSDIAASQNLPQGIYVSQVVIDSSAYAAGMQSGDIIVGMADMDNMAMKSMRNYIESVAVGDMTEVTVMRKGKSGYTELKLEVIFGAYK